MSKFSILYLLFQHNLCLLWQFMFLFSDSHTSNQKAQLFLLCFYPALNMVFKVFSLFCVLFYMALLVQGAGYFSQKFQGPFPMTKFV